MRSTGATSGTAASWVAARNRGCHSASIAAAAARWPPHLSDQSAGCSPCERTMSIAPSTDGADGRTAAGCGPPDCSPADCSPASPADGKPDRSPGDCRPVLARAAAASASALRLACSSCFSALATWASVAAAAACACAIASADWAAEACAAATADALTAASGGSNIGTGTLDRTSRGIPGLPNSLCCPSLPSCSPPRSNCCCEGTVNNGRFDVSNRDMHSSSSARVSHSPLCVPIGSAGGGKAAAGGSVVGGGKAVCAGDDGGSVGCSAENEGLCRTSSDPRCSSAATCSETSCSICSRALRLSACSSRMPSSRWRAWSMMYSVFACIVSVSASNAFARTTEGLAKEDEGPFGR